MDLAPLVSLLHGRRAVVLTGAGCSTESGIPAYRGEGAPARPRTPIQHRAFLDRAETRQRYWARSVLGWPRLATAQPNAAHLALAELERRGVLAGVITQNVDGLHAAAGSRAVVELHGAVGRVRCLGCGGGSARDALQAKLVAANPGWLDRAARAETAPDGDADLADHLVTDFSVVPCERCGGTLMPDVVFYGGTVPRATLDAAWALFDAASVLLVVGSSLSLFSGYRFVLRAAERKMPVAIVNRGPTRGDDRAAARLDARAAIALPALAGALDAR